MPAPSTLQDPSATLGEPGEELLALAFGGGGFATAFQLGVVHSLLVSDSRAPHVVVGLSAGAVHAATLAEVLQAGSDEPGSKEAGSDEQRRAARLTARVARLRELLEHFQLAAEELIPSLLPDPHEIEAREALEPLQLPVHFAAERRQRQQANRERQGLIDLLNRLLSVRLSVAAATRVAQRLLALAESGAEPRRFARWWRKGRHLTALLFLRHLLPLRRLVRPALGSALRALLRRRPGDTFSTAWLESFLARFHLADAVASEHPVRRRLVDAFDPDHFGRRDLDRVLGQALGAEGAAADAERSPRKIGDYARHPVRPVHVVPVAADVATGELIPVPEETPLVDALLAANAVVPFLPAVTVAGDDGEPRVLVDGMNVANEATAALILLLCRRAHRGVGTVRILPVHHLPVERPDLDDPDGDYPGLVEVVDRVLELRRFRDATVERRLSDIFSRLLPPGRALQTIGELTYLRTALHPIEPERTQDVHRRLALADGPVERRRVLLETVAEGCRATMETTLQPYVDDEPPDGSASCRATIAGRLGHAPDLPGRRDDLGPGLAEICAHCALNRKPDDGPAPSLRRRGTSTGETAVTDEPVPWEWPRADGHRTVPPKPLAVKPSQPAPASAARWPKPQVCLLFSGGVFRGVYQMGVLAALVEADLEPRIFAGSSVGSIMAAMSARVFRSADAERAAGRIAERPAVQRRVADLAATFLALDRLLLTDRLVDFTRRLAHRAGATRVSPAQLDRLFRRYDEGGGRGFADTTRAVVAGLERLLYLDPMTFARLAGAARRDDYATLSRLLSRQVQKLLDRYGVGQEVFGSGPLELLIEHHILGADDDGGHPAVPTFGNWPGATLIATATNLTRGRLDILSPSHPAALAEGLLASSAFPAVFRPRWSWELFADADTVERYVDGGVMDNLPLDAVVEYLEDGAKAGLFARRPSLGGRGDGPPVPHLLFTASLERRTPTLDAAESADLSRSWPRLLARTRQLRYNRKVDTFAASQRHFRILWNEFGDQLQWEPCDVEVVAVKPDWLPGTFAFHPKLGFRRQTQAASIAHGCASTFGALHRLAEQGHGDWLRGWEVGLDGERALDRRAFALEEPAEGKPPDPDARVELTPQRRREDGTARADGECWFRTGATCPFARRNGEDGRGEIEGELRRIYEACGERENHRRRPR